jgi:Rieske Fe-S protein
MLHVAQISQSARSALLHSPWNPATSGALDTPDSWPYLRPRMDRLSRREVIKTFALGTAISNVIGQSWAASLLLDVRALSHIGTGILKVNLADFPELNNAGGSVRVGTSPIVRRGSEDTGPAGLFHPVIINRSADFFVLHAECTHAGCTVGRMNAQSIMECPCHFSQFAADGSVRRGPAQQPLRRLPFRRVDDTLEIEMPDVFFEIKAERVPSASRVHLSFLGFANLTYEVHFRPSLEAPLQRVNFATTPDGPMTQTELPGGDDFAHLYVERPGAAGFFHVTMKTLAV